MSKQTVQSKARRFPPIIPELQRLGHENFHEFQVSLGYRVSLSLSAAPSPSPSKTSPSQYLS